MDKTSLPTHAQQRCLSGSCLRARTWPLAGMYLAAASIAALAGGGLAAFNAWGSGNGVMPALLGGACVLGTALLTLGALRAMNFGMVATKANPHPTVQPTMLTGMSTARMLLSLVVGLGVYLLLKPEGKTFWVAFLLGGLLSLCVETAWSVRWLREAALSTDSQPAGAPAPAPEVGS